MRQHFYFIFFIFLFNAILTSETFGSNHYDNFTNQDTVFFKFDNKSYWWFYDNNDKIVLNKDTKHFFRQLKRDLHKIASNEKYKAIDNLRFIFLYGLKKADLINLIGKPNKRYDNLQTTGQFIYYIESICFKKDSDCCWINVYFDSDNRVNFIIEECT